MINKTTEDNISKDNANGGNFFIKYFYIFFLPLIR